jgi:hypothetical protein
MTHAEKLAKLALAEQAYADASDYDDACIDNLKGLMSDLGAFQTADQEDEFWLRVWQLVEARARCIAAYEPIRRLKGMIHQQEMHPTPESHPGTVMGPPKTLKGPAAAKSLSPKAK